MKAALLVVLLAVPLVSIPALATSIPVPPVTSVSFSGVNTTGSFFNSPSDYKIGGANGSNTNFCTVDCVGFEVQSAPGCGPLGSCGPSTNFASMNGFGGSPNLDGAMFGHLGRVSFNPQTDILTALFGGKEQMSARTPRGFFPVYWYTVQGVFTLNMATGVGSMNLTKETFIGTTAVPEPGTWLMMGTGLCAIAGLVRRKLTGVSPL